MVVLSLSPRLQSLEALVVDKGGLAAACFAFCLLPHRCKSSGSDDRGWAYPAVAFMVEVDLVEASSGLGFPSSSSRLQDCGPFQG